jgi:hypothetical protein
VSGIIWFAVALAGAGLLWLTYFSKGQQGGGPLSWRERLVLCLPVLFLALILLQSGAAGERIQFIWTGMEFPLLPGSAVSLGGNAERDDVYLPGFHERALVIERRGRGAKALVLLRREDPTVLASLGNGKGEHTPWGYRPLVNGAVIEVPQPDGSAAQVRFRDGYFQGPLGAAEFSTRVLSHVPGSFALLWDRAFGRTPLSRAPLHLGFLFLPKTFQGNPCERTRTFVYRLPAKWFGSQYMAAFADAGAHLQGTDPDPVEKRLPVEPGETAELAMRPSGCIVGEKSAEVRLGKQVSFRLAVTNDTLVVELGSPVRFSFPKQLLTNASSSTLTVMAVSGLRQSVSGIDLGADHVTSTVGFSRRLAAGMAALRGKSAGPDGMRLDAPVSQLDVPWGAVIRLGSDAQIVLKTRKVGLPWLGLWLLFAITVSLVIVTGKRGVPLSLLAILGPALLLLSMRLLLAHRIWAAYPVSQSAIHLAIQALFLVPAVILAAASLGSLAHDEKSESGRTMQRAGLILALGAPLYLLGAGFGGAALVGSHWVICVVSLACAAVCAGWRLVVRWCRRLENWGSDGSNWLLLGLCGIAVLRLAAALLLGWREAIFIFGQRLAVSIVWTPASVLFTALVALRMERFIMHNRKRAAPARSNLLAIVVTVVAFVLWHAVSVAAGDFGCIVVDLPASLLVMAGIAGVHLRGLEWRQAPLLAIPFALVLVCLFVPQVVSAPLKWGLADPVNDPLAVNRRAAYYRMLSTLNRRELDRIGTLESEALRNHLGIANSLSAGSAFGAGYLKAEFPREGAGFLSSLLSDNTDAVLIAPDWGLGGHWGLCLVLMTIPIAIMSGRFTRRFAALVQLSAVGYFVYGALYMIGANTFLGPATLLPFTGRNLHLLNVQSGSDLLESALLLALAAYYSGKK